MSELPAAAPLAPEVGVIALVPDRWSDQWQPRHHVLSRLARYFRVMWVNPAPGWRDVVRHPREYRSAVDEPVPGFSVHSPDRWLPEVHRPHLVAEVSFRLRLQGARRALERAGCTHIILYIWHPKFANALSAVDHDLSCYHIDDEYTFSPVEQPIPADEMQLLTKCDEVFIHSPGLMAKKGMINPHTTCVPNGVDYDAFAQPAPIPPELAAIPHPRIGYTGWLKQQLDWPLWIALAERHPEWSFVLVGGQKDEAETESPIAELSKLPNVHLLGPRATAALAAYPQHFDVCLMPYRLDDYTKYIYPLKLHEYLATGRPTVGTPIQSLQPFASVVALPSTADGWSRAIAEALGEEENAPERCAERQRVAREHDWAVLVGRIAQVMAAGLGRPLTQILEGPEARELASFMQ